MADLYDYKALDGTVYEGISATEALKLKQDDEDEKAGIGKKAKHSKAQEVMAKLEQLSTSGNYSLEGATALAAKNQVSDDPNVKAYIKNMGDELINKNTDAQFGIDRQNMGSTLSGQSPSAQPAPAANTMNSWSSGSPQFNEPALSEDNQVVADSVQLDRNAAPWSNQPSGPAANTVASAFSGSQPAMTPPAQEQTQNSFVTRLPNEMQQYIKRTGLTEDVIETPVREFLIKRDGAKFFQAMSALVKSKTDLDMQLKKAEDERNLNFTKDMVGKLPISGADGSQSFSADDAARGKVSFGTTPLPPQINRSESHSYQHYIGAGGKGNTSEGLVKLLSDRTAYIQSLRESSLSPEEKTNDIRKYNSFIDQEAKRSGFTLPKVMDKSVVKRMNEMSTWLETEGAKKDKQRHQGYSKILSDYEAMKVEYGVID